VSAVTGSGAEDGSGLVATMAVESVSVAASAMSTMASAAVAADGDIDHRGSDGVDAAAVIVAAATVE
jgi:hypothetical protein